MHCQEDGQPRGWGTGDVTKVHNDQWQQWLCRSVVVIWIVSSPSEMSTKSRKHLCIHHKSNCLRPKRPHMHHSHAPFVRRKENQFQWVTFLIWISVTVMRSLKESSSNLSSCHSFSEAPIFTTYYDQAHTRNLNYFRCLFTFRSHDQNHRIFKQKKQATPTLLSKSGSMDIDIQSHRPLTIPAKKYTHRC